jgi:queuine tRNA-ribosyltransferase
MQLGADILFCLDDCTSPTDPPEEQRASVDRTIAWARECRREFDVQLAGRRLAGEQRPLLFAVIQGGGDRSLRRACAEALAAIGFDGYGFGGWPIDDQGQLLTDVLGYTAELAPAGAPLHALGVGKPENVVAGYDLGYRLFDCALPTRDARHNRLFVFASDSGAELVTLDLRAPGFYRAVHIADEQRRADRGPLSECCPCLACTRYSVGYLHHLYSVRDPLAHRLGALHNLTFYSQLMALLGGAGSPAEPAESE